MNTIAVSTTVLRWAAARAKRSDAEISKRYPKWEQWLTGEAQPTLKQLESFAHFTHTAFGYFFLPTPPTLTKPKQRESW
jgi:hypothetical protein